MHQDALTQWQAEGAKVDRAFAKMRGLSGPISAFVAPLTEAGQRIAREYQEVCSCAPDWRPLQGVPASVYMWIDALHERHGRARAVELAEALGIRDAPGYRIPEDAR